MIIKCATYVCIKYEQSVPIFSRGYHLTFRKDTFVVLIIRNFISQLESLNYKYVSLLELQTKRKMFVLLNVYIKELSYKIKLIHFCCVI